MDKDELEKYKQSLPPGVLKDMQIGGKTQSPMGDLAMLGATGAAVKGLPALAGVAGNLAKNEVAKMTISDAAFKKGMLPQLTKGGIQNWKHLRPWKAFTPQMLKTGPTPAAAAALGLTIEGAGAPPAIAELDMWPNLDGIGVSVPKDDSEYGEAGGPNKDYLEGKGWKMGAAAGKPLTIAGIPSGGWTIGGKKKTGMGSLTPQAVEDLIKNNPGAAEKIRKLYQQQQEGTELFPGV